LESKVETGRFTGANDLKTKAVFLTLMVIFFFSSAALAQSADPGSAPPLILTDEQEEYALGPYLEILEDPGGELTIEQVSSPAFDSRFTPSQVSVPNFGFTDSTFWVRIHLDNETQQADEWLLKVGFVNMHYVDLYSPAPDGEGFVVKQSGDLRPPATRDVTDPNIIFKLDLPTQNQQTFYLRFQTGASMTLPLTLWTKDAFYIDSQLEKMWHWLYYGAIMALLIYHLFLLFTLREKTYLYFVILLTSLILTQLSYDGYLEVYFSPGLYAIKEIYFPLFYALIIASMVLFTDAFLELKARLPIIHRGSIVIVAGWGALMLLSPFTRWHVDAILMAAWAVLSFTAILATGIASWRQGFHPARFFMIAWLGLIASFLMLLMVRLGFASSTLFTENSYRLGIIWMSLCWSIALADRINLLKARTESANRELRNSEHRLSQILEGLPLGVMLYEKDQKPKYANQRTLDILSNPTLGIRPDLSAGRTLAQAIEYFSLKIANSDQEYPLENFPVSASLHGEPAYADDIEMERGSGRVSLEFWANPVRDEAGNVESAVVAFQDITQRKQAEAELVEYRQHLEMLVEKRTAELNATNSELDVANKELQLRLEWLSAIVLVNEIMARSSDFVQIFDKIIEIINRFFAVQDSFIVKLDEGSKQLLFLAHSCCEDSHPDLIGSSTSLPEGVLPGSDLKAGKVIFISGNQLNSLSGPIGIHIQVTKIQGIAFVPLKLHDQVFGFLGLELHEEGRIITTEESNLLNIFSTDIAHVMEDARLYEQTRALITAEERNRLARDLHDSVTQVLFSASLVAEILPQRIRDDPETAILSAAELQRLTHGALAEMRTLLLELRPAVVTKTPLGQLLSQLTEAITSRTEITINLFIDNVPSLPPDVQTTFYRVAQEALNNVVKHAQASQVTVSLNAIPQMSTPGIDEWEGEVMLRIRDDGTGYTPGDQNSEHMGLGIMRERAATIQAELDITSQPGMGTGVTLIWRKGNAQERT